MCEGGFGGCKSAAAMLLEEKYVKQFIWNCQKGFVYFKNISVLVP